MADASTSRRTFLKATTVSTAGVAAWGHPVVAEDQEACTMSSLIEPGDVVLFQGDSITDAGRSREQATEANQQVASSSKG
ncbi:MAG: twin-arginine translocation signal domain-containing protein [Planctomycetaceae bacterium]